MSTLSAPNYRGGSSISMNFRVASIALVATLMTVAYVYASLSDADVAKKHVLGDASSTQKGGPEVGTSEPAASQGGGGSGALEEEVEASRAAGGGAQEARGARMKEATMKEATRPAASLGNTSPADQKIPNLGQFDGEPKVYTYKVIKSYKHDPKAFTQGLIYQAPDTLYESTGSVNGPSTVREVDLTTGEVRNKNALGTSHFAEGLALSGDKLALITWRSPQGFLYDRKTLAKVGEFKTPLRDGWGLTNDPTSDMLIVTDAGDSLHFLKTAGDRYVEDRATQVKDGERVIRFTNELETVGNEVWANVLERECIARIDPQTGKVVGWILMSGIRDGLDPAHVAAANVLNGIAHDPDTGRVWVTGKLWPNLFEVEFEEVPPSELERARAACHPPVSLPQYGYP